jgi:NADPH-dependent 2,4-dienoyl-CoA reductase/sulfur reductase-like enzyme
LSDKKKLLIVGGVAGGASCAARARRLSETAGIIIFERGPYFSFANCGLPYYIGNVIKEEQDLLIATPELFRDRFNIEVRLGNEVKAIDRDQGRIEVRDHQSGTTYHESYDALVLAPGANPIRPPLPGIDLDGVLTLRSIPDSRGMNGSRSEKPIEWLWSAEDS